MLYLFLTYAGPTILAFAGFGDGWNGSDWQAVVEQPRTSITAPAKRSADLRSRSGGGGQNLDLLSLIDLPRDRVSGQWSFREGGLWMEGGHRPKLALPVAPRVSYELDVDFTMKAGYQFGITLPLNPGRTLVWVRAAHKGSKDSISLGRYHDANPYGVKKVPSNRLVGGRKSMTIRVETKGHQTRISVVLEDERILEWKGPKTSLTINPDFAMPSDSLGLTNWGTTVLIHKLNLRILRLATPKV